MAINDDALADFQFPGRPAPPVTLLADILPGAKLRYHRTLKGVHAMLQVPRFHGGNGWLRVSTIADYLVTHVADCEGATWRTVSRALASIDVYSVQKSNGCASFPMRELRKKVNAYMAELLELAALSGNAESAEGPKK